MSIPKTKKVIIAMSGGVDSSVAAILLKKQGYQAEGIFMRLGIEGDNRSEKSARAVAEKIGIKLRVVNLKKEFKEEIIDYFISEYEKGRTPNPCVKCNKEIKFGLLIDEVLSMGADFIATGHYVKNSKFKIRNSIFIYKLLKAKDKNKDQSYFLYTLTQKKLKHCLFPLGDHTKDEVRKIAKRYNFKIDDKEESQEICFITSKYYGNFLQKHLKLKSGDIVDASNNILGSHKGLPLYTIGQRRDIRIGGTGPYYVIGIDKRKNQLVVSNNKNDKNLYSKRIIVNKVNWISKDIPRLPLKVKAKTRYRMDEQSAEISKIKNKYVIIFSKSQRAVMSGQSVVFYRENEILGGGIIK